MAWTPQTLARVRQWALAGALLALVAGSLSQVVAIQAQHVEGQARERQMVSNARLALELITRDVRVAGYNPTAAPFAGLAYTPTSVHLRADLDGDGTLEAPDEDVRYTYDPAQHQIRRLAKASETIVAEHIHSMTVVGLDALGQPTRVPAEVRQLQITITAQDAPATSSTSAGPVLPPYTMQTRVALRNLPSGLDASRS